ncbi:hypothetical protein CEXT_372631 [Caerostris extrusa]|uniref:Uncharacterized protein n=1 Tax=Caerostris extrusa TaxID=172846 RepID=A0AAV4TUZ3_CAEEX|nr:hypothetical protein CEXT_372631 [Caerostris extrusa]
MQNNVRPTMPSRGLSVFAFTKLNVCFCRGRLFNYRLTEGLICQPTRGCRWRSSKRFPQEVLRKNVLTAIPPTKKGDREMRVQAFDDPVRCAS